MRVRGGRGFEGSADPCSNDLRAVGSGTASASVTMAGEAVTVFVAAENGAAGAAGAAALPSAAAAAGSNHKLNRT